MQCRLKYEFVINYCLGHKHLFCIIITLSRVSNQGFGNTIYVRQDQKNTKNVVFMENSKSSSLIKLLFNSFGIEFESAQALLLL